MLEKLTQVFPPNTRPARPGVYLTHNPHRGMFALWTGSYWRSQKSTPTEAARAIGKAAFQNKPWQGLAEEPRNG